MNEGDFRRYYHQETHLFDEVSQHFAKDGFLTAFDFFCIVIWKANRAKSKIADRLRSKGYTNLDAAVHALTSQIAAAPSAKERLRVLVEGWKFRLPMASAILTVLYPEDFTVYDVRVCGMLGDFQAIQDRADFETLWYGYCGYLAAVVHKAPSSLSLRDKDRWLWGRSFAKQLKTDISNGFAALDRLGAESFMKGGRKQPKAPQRKIFA
ncbi:MAG: hypothetical protein ACLQMT_01965 [Candidatus Acidiferrales bacterium]